MRPQSKPGLAPTIRLVLLLVAGLLLAGSLTLRDTNLAWNPILFHGGDVWLYYCYASGLTQGLLPYRDFPLEYPPLANVAFVLPLLPVAFQPVGYPAYVWLLLLTNTALSAAAALVVARLVPLLSARPTVRLETALGLYVGLTLLFAPLLPWRYDVFPALLTLLGVYAALRGRPGLAGAWLGFGFAAKLYPVVLLPILAAFYWVQGDRRGLTRLLLGSLAAVVAGVLSFLGAGAKMLSFFQYHQHRGLEFESLPAGVLLLARQMGLAPVGIAFNFGAFHLVSPWAAPILRVLPFAFALVFALVLALAVRRFRADQSTHGRVLPETLISWFVAALLAFIITNKVFSPQYLIWLLPFVPLLPRRSAALLTVVFALTIVLYPFSLVALLGCEPWAVALLNLRNLLVAVALCDLIAGRQVPAPSMARPVLPTITAKAALGESP